MTHYERDMMGRANLAEESDARLLRRFVDEQDECAFACLVSRHAGVVFGVCYRITRNRQDAEDAFQAVLLTMATKSRSLKNARSLSAWLYGVSVRTSRNLRRMNHRWQRAMVDGHQTATATNDDDGQSEELIRWLDEELARLPDRYREVLVLCDLEERTRQEAARQLAIMPGTVASRLARGRKLLRAALERRGVTIAIGGGVAGALSQVARSAPAASPELIQETVRGAMSLAAGNTLMFAASERVATLVHEVMKTMMIAKLKTVSSLCILAVAIAAAAPAVTSKLGLSGSTASAGTIFHDDFQDGSATDGAPVTWTTFQPWPFTSFSISDGNLVVATTRPDNFAVIGVPEVILEETSIRAQVRVEGVSDDSAAIFVRGIVGNGAYTLDIDGHGVLWSSIAGGSLQTVQTDLRPKEEDVIIQLDAIGNTISGWAWRAGEDMPDSPLISRVDDQFLTGIPGVNYSPPLQPEGELGTAIYRYVHVADESIRVIPEPSTSVLCGIAALAVGIWRWPRLSRP